MTNIEAIAYTILHLESFASMSECGVYSDKEVEGAAIVAKLLRGKYPKASGEAEAITDRRHARRSALLFKGYEHELPEAAQIELYGKVVAKSAGAR